MKKELFNVLKVYAVTWIIVIVLMMSRAFDKDISIPEAFDTLLKSLTYTSFLLALHILFVITYILFIIIRYFIRLYHKKGKRVLIKRLLVRIIIPVSVITIMYQFIVYKNTYEHYDYDWDYSVENKSEVSKDLFLKDGKHRGMSVFGWRKNNTKAITHLIKNNVEWVAITPFLYQKNEQSVDMTVPREMGKWSRRDSLFIRNITEIKQKGMHIQLKPHLWLGSGWRSDVMFNTQKEWDTWFEFYRKNMIHYAMMAQQTDVELFCIGTELRTSLENQQEKWKSLVKEIKSIYSGKLTYAANWDGEFEKIEFWNELDYIGIQAYFPLTQKPNPNLNSLKKGWNRHISLLETLSKKHQKPILFTEVGYKSEASATVKPWEWNNYTNIFYKKKSNKTQQLAFEALFECLWDKEWFSGMYIWEWNINSEQKNADTDLGFSPRFKPSENSIAKGYHKVVKPEALDTIYTP